MQLAPLHLVPTLKFFSQEQDAVIHRACPVKGPFQEARQKWSKPRFSADQ